MVTPENHIHSEYPPLKSPSTGLFYLTSVLIRSHQVQKDTFGLDWVAWTVQWRSISQTRLTLFNVRVPRDRLRPDGDRRDRLRISALMTHWMLCTLYHVIYSSSVYHVVFYQQSSLKFY